MGTLTVGKFLYEVLGGKSNAQLHIHKELINNNNNNLFVNE